MEGKVVQDPEVESATRRASEASALLEAGKDSRSGHSNEGSLGIFKSGQGNLDQDNLSNQQLLSKSSMKSTRKRSTFYAERSSSFVTSSAPGYFPAPALAFSLPSSVKLLSSMSTHLPVLWSFLKNRPGRSPLRIARTVTLATEGF